MRVNKPAIAMADIPLLRKVIIFYLNKHPDPKEQDALVILFHRLGRLEEKDV